MKSNQALIRTTANKLVSKHPKNKDGPDALYLYFLKVTVEIAAEPLECIYNNTLENYKIPDILKVAFVPPITKTGHLSNPNNCRPCLAVLEGHNMAFQTICSLCKKETLQ